SARSAHKLRPGSFYRARSFCTRRLPHENRVVDTAEPPVSGDSRETQSFLCARSVSLESGFKPGWHFGELDRRQPERALDARRDCTTANGADFAGRAKGNCATLSDALLH